MATLKVNRGTTYSITGTYSEDGVATSLTGATVRFTMKDAEYDTSIDDTTASVKKNVDTGTSGGEFTITLDPSDTSELEPGDYFYDIKVDKASDGVTVYKIDEGKIKLDGSPTNRLS